MIENVKFNVYGGQAASNMPFFLLPLLILMLACGAFRNILRLAQAHTVPKGRILEKNNQ